jgi:uncharacterized protein YcbX
MPGQPHVGVRHDHTLKFGVVEITTVSPFDKCVVVAPIPIDGKNEPPLCVGRCRIRPNRRERFGRQCRARDHRTGGLDEFASVHEAPF